MLSLLDIAERSQSGPKMSEMDWDMGLFGKITELATKYEIRAPADGNWFNMDEDLPRRAFQAGIDFLSETGVYCLSTGRVVRFSRDEVLTAIREAPNSVVMGEGADQRTFRQQQVEGSEPLNVCPGHHAPFTVDQAPWIVESFARLPRADFLEGFNFTEVDGREIYGLPMEAYAVRRQMDYLRQGIRRAGRPGMAIVLYPINTRVGALLAALDPDYGLRRTDGMLLSVLPDLKVEHDLLTAAIVGHDYGLFTLSGSFSIVGGFCGGVEGAIIEGIAKPLAAMLVYRDYINYVGVEHASGVSVRKIVFQPVSWARSVVTQALNRHSNTICMAWIIPTSGPGTEANLIEVAIRSIEAQVNGGNLYAIRHSRAQMNAGQTPLEAEWMVEVADATLRAELRREEAGRICHTLAQRLVGREPEPGHTIAECYDLLRHRPLPTYDRIYRQLKDDLSTLGLDFG